MNVNENGMISSLLVFSPAPTSIYLNYTYTHKDKYIFPVSVYIYVSVYVYVILEPKVIKALRSVQHV